MELLWCRMDCDHVALRRWKYVGSVSCLRRGNTDGNETYVLKVEGRGGVRLDEKQEISLRE
jgi:hypothetical protein